MKKNRLSNPNSATGRQFRMIQLIAVICALMLAYVQSTFADSQTWSNAPVSGEWTNVLNWVSGTNAPGAVNQTGGATTADIATFNSPLSGGIGSVGTPIVPDNATNVNARSRAIGGITFTESVGAYVFDSPSPAVLPTATDPGTGILNVCHPNNIVVDASVANKQEFLLPVGVRLPNSTNGRYGITNNAASSDATLFFEAIWNLSAGTRPLQLFLDGSNTGTNTIASLVEQASGALQVIKNGSGRWILSGANTWSQQTDVGVVAGLLVNQGTLVVQNAASLGALTAANIQVTNSVLQIDGVLLNNIGVTLRNGGNVRMNGSSTLSGVIVANQPGNTCTVSTTSASDEFTVGEGLIAGMNISGGASDSVLRTAGPGTITLGAGAGAIPNSYAGNWSLEAAKTVCQPTPFNGARNVHLSAGATLDLSPLGGSYGLESLTFSASGSGASVGSTAAAVDAGPGGTFSLGSKTVRLDYAPTSAAGDLTHPALYISQGSLSLGGNTITVNNTSGSPLGAGTYRLIQQASGSIASSGNYTVLVTGDGLVTFGVASISVSGGNLDMVVALYFPQDLAWRGGNPDAVWNVNSKANFDLSSAFSVFNNTDNVLFSSLGSTNPTVTIEGNVAPTDMTVDTSASDYTFTGSGAISGAASVTKIGTGVMSLNTANTYLGGTTVSNGTLRVAIDNALPSVGSAAVEVYSPGVVDMNGYTNTIPALNGDGTVDIQSGTSSTLNVGNNDTTSSFSGVLTNSSGVLGLNKIGNGQLTLTSPLDISGSVVVNAGTLTLLSPNSFNKVSGLNIVNGNVRIGASQTISNMAGSFSVASLANASGAGDNTITSLGNAEFTGIISDGASGTIRVYVPSGNSLILHGASTYSGGTIVASGATLGIGAVGGGINVAGAAGTGGIIASNGATVSLPTALGVAGTTGSAITNIDAGGTIYLSSASQGNSFNGQFVGGVNNTNVFSGPLSIGGNYSFSNFLGTVIITNGASVRWFQGTGIDAGGDNTTFLLEGNLFHRDPRNARLGALIGANGSIGGPTTPPGTWTIGAKNLSNTFSGSVVASNNLIKVGSESLTLNGVTTLTNTVTLPGDVIVAFALKTNRIAYTGTTTVSNGILRVVAPNNLTNSSIITVAGGTLDASQIGFGTNQTTLDINTVEQPTNTVVVVSAELEILAGRTLAGRGNITGSVKANAGSTVNLGLPQGTLAVSGTASLNGAVNLSLNRTNDLANQNGAMTATSFSGSGATLTVTNLGPTLVTGDTFQLFNGPVTAFTTVILPTASADNSITYQWETNLTSNGSIKVLLGASAIDTTPTNITVSVSGDTMTLTWPESHIGWTLWTNAGNIGNAGDWYAYPPSTTTDSVDLTIDPTKANVYFQLRYEP